jgi:hypothetical protein
MTTIYPPSSFIDNLRSPFNQQAVTGAALPLFVASKVMYSTPATLATAGHVTAIAQTLSGAKNLQDGLQLAGGQLVTAISTSDTLVEDSDSVLATQKAVKSYVDAHTTVDLPISGFYGPFGYDIPTKVLSLTNNAMTRIDTISIDGTMTADSDVIIPTQKATRTYALSVQKVATAGLPLVITGKHLTINVASPTQSGYISAANQSFAGIKEFNQGITIASGTNISSISTDTAMALNSDNVLSTQKATKTYVDTVTGNSLTTGDERIVKTVGPGGYFRTYTDNVLRDQTAATRTLYTPLHLNVTTPTIKFIDAAGAHDWEQRFSGTTFGDYLDNVLIRSINSTREEVFKPLRVTSATQPQFIINQGAATSSFDLSAGGVLGISGQARTETLSDSWIVAPKPSFVMTDTITGDSYRTEVDATAYQIYQGVNKRVMLTPSAFAVSLPIQTQRGANIITIDNDVTTTKPTITASNGLPVLIPTGIQLQGPGPVFNSLTADANANVSLSSARWKQASATSFLRAAGGSAASMSAIGVLGYYAWEYSGVSSNELFATLTMPVDVLAANAQFVGVFNWTSSSASAGNVHWRISLDLTAPGAAHGFGTNSADIIAANGTTAYINHRNLSSTFTFAAPVKGSIILLRIARTKDASDTFGGSAWLTGFAFSYTADKLIGDSSAL